MTGRRTECAIACAHDSKCQSFSFCYGKLCHLNYKKVSRSCLRTIKNDGNCVYFEMNTTNITHCDYQYLNQNYDILESSSLCGENVTNESNDLYEWGIWFDGPLQSDDSETWLRKRVRKCLLKDEVTDIYLCAGCWDYNEKLNLIADKKSWFDAEQYCSSNPDPLSGRPRL